MAMAMSRHLIVLGVALFGLVALTGAATTTPNMQSMLDEEHSKCESGEDSIACMKVRAMRFLDTVMSKDSFKFSDMEVRANGLQAPAERNARAHTDADFFDSIENYIKSHDVTMDLPVADTKVTISSRNLVNDEFNLKFNFANDAEGDVVEGKGKKGNFFKKGKKHRLRKMLMPIMVLVLLKAITVIPMAIGILKIKALNALALGFLSFIVSVGLAIFQLCKKIAAEHHTAHAHITHAHGGWDGRSLVPGPSQVESSLPMPSAQNLAYNAYV